VAPRCAGNLAANQPGSRWESNRQRHGPSKGPSFLSGPLRLTCKKWQAKHASIQLGHVLGTTPRHVRRIFMVLISGRINGD
jgi:hypothetical protein